MSFKLIGNGTTTSSVAITTFAPTNVFPIVPEPYTTDGRDILHVTESGMQHGYTLGQRQRLWRVGLRLLTADQRNDLEAIYDLVAKSGWIFWEHASGAFEAATINSATDNHLVLSYIGQYRNMVVITTGGTGSGQTRRVTGTGAGVGGGTAMLVSANWSVTPDATTTYVLGWPVRFSGPLAWERYPVDSHNSDFLFEEMILTDTV